MDGWMDGWMEGDGWMDGGIYVCMYVCMYVDKHIYIYISCAALGSRRSLNPFKQECTEKTRLQRGTELRSQS